LNPCPGGFTLLHADSALLVFDKPPGLLCVPGRGADKQDSLSARAQAVYADALIVHRLDMATSGLVLMARGIENQRRLSAAFAARQVHKCYLALVAGDMCSAVESPSQAWSTIDLPIAPDWPNRPRQKIDHNCGKPSVTRWRLAPAAAFSHLAAQQVTGVELEPVPGRTHQLRLHMAAIGHPILGDALYAPPSIAETCGRLMLHAARLCFSHPVTGEDLQFDSSPTF
jgi:tRNA pseudouridine32 synthase / 23S rRNA pseudouridine746 synthase